MKATSLVEIGDGAFTYVTDLGGTLVIPAKVTTISSNALEGTKLTAPDLSRAVVEGTTALDKSRPIGKSAFSGMKMPYTSHKRLWLSVLGAGVLPK